LWSVDTDGVNLSSKKFKFNWKYNCDWLTLTVEWYGREYDKLLLQWGYMVNLIWIIKKVGWYGREYDKLLLQWGDMVNLIWIIKKVGWYGRKYNCDWLTLTV
jgi:hypothetical protein